MKRGPKIHLMAEHNSAKARCGSSVTQDRLTACWDLVTCKECGVPHDAYSRARISAILAKGNAVHL
jgi:hypothetical protein